MRFIKLFIIQLVVILGISLGYAEEPPTPDETGGNCNVEDEVEDLSDETSTLNDAAQTLLEQGNQLIQDAENSLTEKEIALGAAITFYENQSNILIMLNTSLALETNATRKIAIQNAINDQEDVVEDAETECARLEGIWATAKEWLKNRVDLWNGPKAVLESVLSGTGIVLAELEDLITSCEELNSIMKRISGLAVKFGTFIWPF